MIGRRTRLAIVVPAAVAVLGLSTVPALAAPAEPAKPQAGDAAGEPLGKAIGNAGTLLAAVRALPGLQGLPGLPDLPIPGLPPVSGGGNGLLSLGLGLSSVKTNSEAAAPNTAAEAAQFALSLFGNTPTAPGTVSQTAPPDNEEPTTGGFDIPDNPLLTGSLLKTSAHARYSDKLGPCVDPIGQSKTSVADLQVLPGLPGLPDLPEVPGLPRLQDLAPVKSASDVTGLLSPEARQSVPNAENLAGPFGSLLDMLGGIPGLSDLLGNLPGLPGGGGSQPSDTALIGLPKTLSTESTVRLVDMKDSKKKAVQSTSKLRVVSLRLLQGTPFELRIDVVADPTLQVTSTGKKETSKVTYKAPILKIYRGGEDKPIYELDATNPTFELPLAMLPIGPGALEPVQAANVLNQTPALAKALGVQKAAADPKKVDQEDIGYGPAAALAGDNKLSALPIIGDLPGLPDFSGFDLNLGVIRLSIAHREDTGAEKQKPFKGYEIGSTARLLNVEVLPGGGLDEAQLPEVPGLPGLNGPLAQVVLGEQIAKAYAPKGGVDCGVKKPPPPPSKQPPPPPKGQGAPPPPLAYTDAAYQTVPLFWTGAGLVLAGAALVAFRPLRRRFAGKHRAE